MNGGRGDDECDRVHVCASSHFLAADVVVIDCHVPL